MNKFSYKVHEPKLITDEKEKILSLKGKMPVREFMGLKWLIKIYRLDIKDIRLNW